MFCEVAPMKVVARMSKITMKGFTGMSYATNMPAMNYLGSYWDDFANAKDLEKTENPYRRKYRIPSVAF